MEYLSSSTPTSDVRVFLLRARTFFSAVLFEKKKTYIWTSPTMIVPATALSCRIRKCKRLPSRDVPKHVLSLRYVFVPPDAGFKREEQGQSVKIIRVSENTYVTQEKWMGKKKVGEGKKKMEKEMEGSLQHNYSARFSASRTRGFCRDGGS